MFGYEALARITNEQTRFSVEEMFVLAERCGKLWELEYLCRKKAMKGITDKQLGKRKLFLNVDPYIINDKRFQCGMTQKYLDIDNFKAYNDAYGFENGDLMIQAVADSMKISCRKGEFLGHIGGDDFSKKIAKVRKMSKEIKGDRIVEYRVS